MNSFAFIDSQNLNLGVKSAGWQLEFRKFRLYLKHKFEVSKAYLFIGMVPGNEVMYRRLQEMGYILVFKPTMQYKKDGKIVTKGNLDAELVLYASTITYAKYDRAIIVSGDGDFHCLVEFLVERGKLLKILAPNRHYSGILRRFDSYILRIDQLRNALETKKTGTSGRSKP
ncbi:NYN domain-containing protein [Candidatus Berkelbacteria bacterium]|nr:NYN domain-containing protein [Candidatus Berkelbacteria bacterium]